MKRTLPRARALRKTPAVVVKAWAPIVLRKATGSATNMTFRAVWTSRDSRLTCAVRFVRRSVSDEMISTSLPCRLHEYALTARHPRTR